MQYRSKGGAEGNKMNFEKKYDEVRRSPPSVSRSSGGIPNSLRSSFTERLSERETTTLPMRTLTTTRRPTRTS